MAKRKRKQSGIEEYYCKECGSVLQQIGYAGNKIKPTVPCKSCGNNMDFNVWRPGANLEPISNFIAPAPLLPEEKEIIPISKRTTELIELYRSILLDIHHMRADDQATIDTMIRHAVEDLHYSIKKLFL